VGLVFDHRDAFIAAFLIGFVIRLLKDDTVLPTVPARARPWLSLFGGLLLGAAEKVLEGKTWEAALIDALLAGFLPMGGDGIVKSVLGKDVPLPGLEKKKET
jgi:hypothetical protein